MSHQRRAIRRPHGIVVQFVIAEEGMFVAAIGGGEEEPHLSFVGKHAGVGDFLGFGGGG
jgi:hypothetical protein